MDAFTTDNPGFEELLGRIKDGVFVLDSERRFVVFNSYCERLMGRSASEVIGTECRCYEINGCVDEQGHSLTGTLCPGLAVLRGEVAATTQRMRINVGEGQHKWIETSYTVLGRKEDGTPQYILAIVRDISVAKEHEHDFHQRLDELKNEIDHCHTKTVERYGFSSIVTRSPNMEAVQEKIWSACSNGECVLLVGEQGTGKGNIAHLIHNNGLHKDGPFIPFGCAGQPQEQIEAELFGQASGEPPEHETPGLIRAASDGSILIGDIDVMPTATQLRLLRTIEDRQVRPVGGTTQLPIAVRFVASTRTSPRELVSEGRLAEALAYRLGTLTIELPPLRERKADIPLLVGEFLMRLNGEGARRVTMIDPRVWSVLEAHDWPGNIRELRTVIDAAFLSGHDETLRPEEIHFPATALVRPTTATAAGGGVDPDKLDDALAGVERRVILGALRRAGGQRSLAAKMMGISRSRLYRRMEALSITREDEAASI